MSKWDLAWWKTRPGARRLAAFLAALAVVLGATVVAGGPAYASGLNCTDNGDAVICINVNGASNIINQIVGHATTDGSVDGGVTGHVQVVDPNGKSLCNSKEVPLTSSSIYVSCVWNGGGKAYPTGNYCTILWIYAYRGAFLGWQYVHDGLPECLNVFVS
jgi:hypothetical protein